MMSPEEEIDWSEIVATLHQLSKTVTRIGEEFHGQIKLRLWLEDDLGDD